MKPSDRFTLNRNDVEKWLKNTAIFAAPAVLIFLTEIQAGKSLEEALVAIKVWLLSTAIDIVRKWISGK